jgi:hypothetical protein
MQAIREQIAGWNGNPSDEECATSLAGIGMFEWGTVGEYLDCLERNRTATNVAMLVPQVRFIQVEKMGYKADNIGEPSITGLWTICYSSKARGSRDTSSFTASGHVGGCCGDVQVCPLCC